MKKTPKCSTWNNFKKRFFRLVAAAFFPIAAAFIPMVSALAAPAVVPVGAGLIAKLLVALGILAVSAQGGYVLAENADPNAVSILEKQIGTITADVPISEETLGQLSGTVIPEDLYTTDGTDFFIGEKKVTASDVFFLAKSMVGVDFPLPVNIDGVADYTRQQVNTVTFGWYSPVSLSDVGNGDCYIPVYGDGERLFYTSYGLSISRDGFFTLYDFSGTQVDRSIGGGSIPQYISAGDSGTVPFVFSGNTPSINDNWRWSTLNWGTQNVHDGLGGVYNKSAVWDSLQYATFVITDGVPTDRVAGEIKPLENAVVQLKTEKDEDNNNGSTPPAPQSPNNWQIWQTVTELIDEIGDGVVTNNGTTYQEYINNNYNYVQIDINVPDTQHIDLSGGLDISGKGDINININEDVSLPSAGDGSGFYNPDAADVVGALSNNNPVISGIKGLFAAIDPALVGVFSVSVSLLLVLGLWKLIRG